MKRTNQKNKSNSIPRSFLAATLAIILSVSFLPTNYTVAAQTMETQAEVFIEEQAMPQENAEQLPVATELVDAPPIVPEGSAAENNIFGVAGMYYVTIPKHMAFRKLSNGEYETVESSRYTVNSALDTNHRLSVRVAGVNSDDTVQLSDEGENVFRKVEVSTRAYDVWNYRPDGTQLITNNADSLGYGKELVLIGPGKYFAKCRLSKFGDDAIHAGTWTGTILFTVSCTPEVEAKEALSPEGDEETEKIEGEDDAETPEEAPAEDVDEAEDDGDRTAASEPDTHAASVADADKLEESQPDIQIAESLPKAEENVAVEAEDNHEDEQYDGSIIDISQLEEEESQEGTAEEEAILESEDLGEPLVDIGE